MNSQILGTHNYLQQTLRIKSGIKKERKILEMFNRNFSLKTSLQKVLKKF